MRLRRAELRGRVKADLALRFTRSGLTSFAGLELVRRYCRQLGLVDRIRRHVGSGVPASDYGIVGMIMVVLTLLIVGGRRVWHVAYVANDPVVRRVTGLRRLPVARTIGRWLASFRVRHLAGLERLNADLVATSGAAALSSPRDVVVDPDGDLIVSDSGNQRVVRLDADGRVSELARLDFQPQSLAYDAKGLLATSGRSGGQLIVVTPAGELAEEAVGGAVDAVLKLDADAALAPEADDGSGGHALRLSVRAVREMVSMSGGAPDGRGGLIVCDEQRGRILRVTRVGGGDASVAAEP